MKLWKTQHIIAMLHSLLSMPVKICLMLFKNGCCLACQRGVNKHAGTLVQLTVLGEFSAEHGEKLKEYLARDLDQTISTAQRLGEEAKERFHPARMGAGALASLAAVLEFTGNALHALSDKAKGSLAYKTGEMTSAGTLTCQACGQKVHLKGTGHVPPCPKCNGTLFNKGY